eukprot:TRINITY_DN88655_c0_g1_i1.p1 TRINITY_DN88655_c0_g1~~TRINITY_DN88655_c0_g1_i1.p1  ORF type:complete len:328 (-),score=57.63 TRINITY_DN88655_c0_g1_i1:166-1149(-)
MDDSANRFFSETNRLQPEGLASWRERLDRFVAGAVARQQRIALVTSGGTTVPLELNTVRFIDNFSTGTRGALCTQEFLQAGYSVVFLHRRGSNFPYATDIVKKLNEAPLQLLEPTSSSSSAPPDIKDRLLAVGFTTIFDYLFLLRECCQSLATAGSLALVFLAAAVSDFYVPEAEMAKEKIQSRAHDGLTISLRNVPKLLAAIRPWAPEAFILSFKLETNPNILEAKAAASLQKYGVDAVCSNLLQTIRNLVTIVERDASAGHGVQLSKDPSELTGEEAEPVEVKGIISRRVEKAAYSVVDVPLVKAVIEMHDARVGQVPKTKRPRI